MKTLLALAVVVILVCPATAIAQQCSQPISDGPEPVATDCLFILNAAVGLQTCEIACICDVDGSGGPPSATDALRCLNVAIGIEVPLDCPCDTTTTTTLSSTTTTVTSTSLSSTTTLTSTTLSSTTTTNPTVTTSTTLLTTTTSGGSTTTLASTTTTSTLPGADDDNDGLADVIDPCPGEALNRCAGTIVVDSLSLREIRVNTINPNDPLFAPCSGERTDCNGDVWDGDFGFNFRPGAGVCNLGVEECTLEGIEDVFGCTDEETAVLFRCEHYGVPTNPNLTYTFGVPDGSYIVNLLFGNIYDQTAAVGARVFDVAIEGVIVLDDFDQIVAAGGSGIAVARSLLVEVGDGDGIDIEFIPVVENPSVKGIEVLARLN